MKKMFVAALFAALVTPLFTSCDKDVRKCYQVTYEASVLGVTTTIETYMWCSANELDAQIEELKKTDGSIKIKNKKATKHSTAEECAIANTEK